MKGGGGGTKVEQVWQCGCVWGGVGGHIHVSCHTSALRSRRIHQMILSITISSWLIKRNDTGCIWRIWKKKKKNSDSDNHSVQSVSRKKKKKKIKSCGSSIPPPLQSWFRGIYSKTSHNSPHSVSSIQICSFSLAQYSIQRALC